MLTRRPELRQANMGRRVAQSSAGDPLVPGDWMDALKDCDAVVNLVGEGIFNHRWTRAFKETLYASRIKSTTNIVAALLKKPRRQDA